MPTWRNWTLRHSGGSIHALAKRLAASLIVRKDDTNVGLELSNTMPVKGCGLIPELVPYYNRDLFSFLSLEDRRRPLSIHSYDGSVETVWCCIVDPSNIPIEENGTGKPVKAKQEKNEGKHCCKTKVQWKKYGRDGRRR